jgi:hypothetical protein
MKKITELGEKPKYQYRLQELEFDFENEKR